MGPTISANDTESNYVLPLDPQSWTVSMPGTKWDEDLYQRTLDDVAKRWKSLAPFFQTQGYHLYEWKGHYSTIPPRDAPPSLTFTDSAEAHPYGWSPPDFFKRDWDYAFTGTKAYRLWAARDDSGREVLIRLVAFPGEESQELKVYRRLNTPEARRDPRNHTLPVLDWLHYSGLTFVVLPRWGYSLIGDHVAAEHILRFADTAIECLVFLHENRIAHRDFAMMNTVSNLMTGDFRCLENADIVRLDMTAVRFALIDFDVSILFPMETDIGDVVLERVVRIQASRAGLCEGPANPFSDDVTVLLYTLQTHTRILEDKIPEVGSFFDTYLKEGVTPPSAVEALRAFRAVTSGCTKDQLLYQPKQRVWRSEPLEIPDDALTREFQRITELRRARRSKAAGGNQII